MRAWCVVVALSYLFLEVVFSSLPRGTLKTGLGIRRPGDDASIDQALYSRQLLVYGVSAQVKLKQATILMVGRSHLNNEIAKNVALAGVGKILFVEQAEDGEGKAPSLLGNAPSPAQYVADLNRNVEVETITLDPSVSDFDWSELLTKHNITVAVAAGANFAALNELDLSCQRAGVKLVACDLHGSCGYIFNNFQRGFKVLDADGEDRKEVVLTNLAEVSHSASDTEGKSTVLLHLTSIEEEKLNVGIGEHVELLERKGNVLDEPFEVIQVMDTRNMKIAIPNSERAETLKELIQRDGALFRKVKATSTVNHESLLLQFLRPSFCPSNACLAAKKDHAVSLGLLACFKVRDRLLKGESIQDSETNNADSSASVETVLTGPAPSRAALRSLVVSELHTMGISEPELSVKQKGQVGSDVIDIMASNFFDSSRKTVAPHEAPAECGRLPRLPECPASAAVVGAVAAQEVIKAVTHMYTPISQFLMFEGIGVSEEYVASASIANVKVAEEKSSAESNNGREGSKGGPTKQPLRRRLINKSKDLLKLSKAPISALSTSVLPATSITTTFNSPTTVTPSAPDTNTTNVLAQLHGAEVMQELQSMRVFVVGAGAIGSEILKNLALLGVGSGTSDQSDTKPVVPKSANGADISVKRRDNMKNSTVSASKAPRSRARKSMWERQGLVQGGIVVTDMDKIERSNLNRQLLFREQHIGEYKSLTAAAQVAQLNPALKGRVHGLTLKVGAETEQTFNGAFWAQTDVVITALDNVEAREYVDAMCVKHGRWLLDSGTLGTKGNTQVVIPFLTESYSSSADPAEEAVPLCTVKSFPYQPEHCVAWAKSRFEEYFNSQVELVAHLRGLFSPTPTATITTTADGNAGADTTATATEDRVRAWLSTLPADQLSGLLKVLRFQPWTSDGALKWAVSEFQTLFCEEPTALLRENPAESNDEEGRPFWGGSRRQPSPQMYDLSNPLHSEFISLVSALLQRVYDCTSASSKDLAPGSDFISSSSSLDEIAADNLTKSEAELVDAILSQLGGSTSVVEFLRAVNFHPQQFEKDDAALGHVEVVAAFSNLRSRLYGIKELGQLQVQKVAGNIFPALATTTSLVAGLVTQELIKLAQERVRFKRFAKSAQTEKESTAARAALLGEKDLVAEAPQNSPSGSIMHTARRWLRWPRATPSIPATLTSTTASAATSSRSAVATTDSALTQLTSRDLPRWYLLQHKERILKRFRNGFVNLARPMLAFAEPVEAEMENYFTQWDSIEARGTVYSLDTNRLSEQLGYQIDSISWGDTLLYADFLPHQKKLRKMSVQNLMLLALRSVQNEGNEAIEGGDSHAVSKGTAKSAEKRLKELLQHEDFVLLDVSVKAEDDAKEEGKVSVPKVKVYIHAMPKV